ncbi:MAG: hypothetical protein V4735_09455 [Pseudomonadota bacterium]
MANWVTEDTLRRGTLVRFTDKDIDLTDKEKLRNDIGGAAIPGAEIYIDRKKGDIYVKVNDATPMPLQVPTTDRLYSNIPVGKIVHYVVEIDSDKPLHIVGRQLGRGRDEQWIAWDVKSGNGHTIETGSYGDVVYGNKKGNTTIINHAAAFVSRIEGGDGNDTLINTGDVQMTGGRGADTFVVDTSRARVTYIKDFRLGEGDKLQLTGLEASAVSGFASKAKEGRLTLDESDVQALRAMLKNNGIGVGTQDFKDAPFQLLPDASGGNTLIIGK